MTSLTLAESFTSRGNKFFAHQEAMKNLRNRKGQPIVTHINLTDICNHTCAFCSVQARAGDSLLFDDVKSYLDILMRYGLKAVILSGGGNPILYKCKKTGANFNDVVDHIHGNGLEIGLITNGMPLKNFESRWDLNLKTFDIRKSWTAVKPETLDKLTWVRISMSGLDHKEEMVFVPDIDRNRTTLGFSYVAHDIYQEPEDPYHGKVSRPLDLISRSKESPPDAMFEERIEKLTDQFTHYIKIYRPRYLRLLPNCLEPGLISLRCRQLEDMAKVINFAVNRDVAFIQQKPPKAPRACYLGYIHPVLNCDGYVYPCDSCVLNESAQHQFANPWRICHWRDIAQVYERPVQSLIKDPAQTCPGCVFTQSNEILYSVVNGVDPIPVANEKIEHENFV